MSFRVNRENQSPRSPRSPTKRIPKKVCLNNPVQKHAKPKITARSPQLSDTLLAAGGLPTGLSPGLPSGLPSGLGGLQQQHQQQQPKQPGAGPGGMVDDPMLLYQYQQIRLLQNQQLFLKQLRASAISKLSQSDQWSGLSPVEQNQLVMQYVRSVDPEMAELSQQQQQQVPAQHPPPQLVPGGFMPQPVPPPPSSSVLQLFPQLHQVSERDYLA